MAKIRLIRLRACLAHTQCVDCSCEFQLLPLMRLSLILVLLLPELLLLVLVLLLLVVMLLLLLMLLQGATTVSESLPELANC